MLKGINRRIIEINRTNSEYFEKAILFVKSEKSSCNQQFLSNQADLFLSELPLNKNKRSRKAKILSYCIFALIICVIAFLIVYSVIVL